MQILSAAQMRAWDQYTIEHEPISSLNLMERAAGKCVAWIKARRWQQRKFLVFCGRGNNGGDGLAIARLLISEGYSVETYVIDSGKAVSNDFAANLERLVTESVPVVTFRSKADFPLINASNVVIDALFGLGLNKPLADTSTQIVDHINASNATVVSIDLPSGLSLEHSSLNQPVIKADFTLTFQAVKQALLLQENAWCVGKVEVLDIGLHPDFLADFKSTKTYLSREIIDHLFKPRPRFSHKGKFGHAAIIAGGWGKIGAAVLAASACLRTGAGLTTAVIPKCGYTTLQSTLTEVMVLADENEKELSHLPKDLEKFTTIGIGPGIGTTEGVKKLVSNLLHRFDKPIVVDADALNCLAKEPSLLEQLPSQSILTPHPKEFERLFGEHKNDFERVETALKKAQELNVIIILKGHHSLIALPDGQCFYNSTGNAGMAKGGSGDVLTGVLTSLLAQGYKPADAAKLGVYIHGWAGDIAAEKFSKQAMTPGDLVDCLRDVFLELETATEK